MIWDATHGQGGLVLELRIGAEMMEVWGGEMIQGMVCCHCT